MGLEPRLPSEKSRFERAPDVQASSRRNSRDCSVDALYRSEASAVRTFVKQIVRNASDAEDIVQETFLRTWPALAAGSVECPRAFIFRAARNLALNHLRHLRVRSLDTARALCDEALKQHVATAEEEMILSEEAAACRRLLSGLPNRCREALMLRVVDDLSYKQMAKSMRLSVSTLEKHIGKGKQICRSLLTDRASADSSFEVLTTRLPPAQQAARRRVQGALSLAAE